MNVLHTLARAGDQVRESGLLAPIVVAVFSVWTFTAAGQELVPRAYWPAPKGTNFLVLGYQYSSGDIVTDASLPVTGVDSSINFAQLTYQRTLSLFDRTANIQFNLPYTWGTTEGVAEGEYRSRDISAMSDVRILLSVNLLGAPSMDVAGFRALRAKPRTIIGASVLVQSPTGDYEADKVINASSNRWVFKLATGVIWPVRPTWLLRPTSARGSSATTTNSWVRHGNRTRLPPLNFTW